MPSNYIDLTPASLKAISRVTSPDRAQKSAATPVAESFSDVLSGMINNVDGLQKESDMMTQQLATGETDNLHDVMIAAEKAKIAMQFTLAIRKQLVQAYQNISQMR